LSRWGSAKTLEDHVIKHAKDFGIDPLSENADQEYIKQSQDFLQRGIDEKLPMIEYKGKSVSIYDPESNIFGAYNSNGRTQTFYKPTSKTYFEREIGDAIRGGGKIINPLRNTIEPVTNVTEPIEMPEMIAPEILIE
jgi:hypothetical protein